MKTPASETQRPYLLSGNTKAEDALRMASAYATLMQWIETSRALSTNIGLLSKMYPEVSERFKENEIYPVPWESHESEALAAVSLELWCHLKTIREAVGAD